MQLVKRRDVQLFMVFALISVVGFLMTTSVALADGLVPCGGPGEPRCDFCQFVSMVDATGKFVAKLLVIICVIMLAWTGIELAYLASAGSDAHQVLKERMVNIVIGFVLIVGAWTVIDTVIRALVAPGNDDFSIVNAWQSPENSGLCNSR